MALATPLTVPFTAPGSPSLAAPAGTVNFPSRRERRPDFERTAPPEPPVLNITIGRVEVRASAPAAAEPKGAPIRRGAAPQSLADYLKRRERAR